MMTLKILFHMDVKWGIRKSPIKGNVKRNISPLRLGAEPFFVSGIQPNLFERALSRFESGLPQAESLISFRRVTCRNVSSSLWFHTCCDGAIRF